MSSELNAIYQAGFLGLFAGATYGGNWLIVSAISFRFDNLIFLGFLGSRKAYYDFLDRNQATAFKSHLDAKKQLQNSVTVSFAKGAYRFGWRLGLFSVSYVGITTTIAVYRGKSSIFEYAAAGALTGATYKFSMGLKGMTAGTLVGGVLGSIAGGVSLLILKSTGMTMEEVRYWQYKWRTSRDDTINEAMKAQTELDPLHIHHDERFGTDKLSLNAIEPKPVTALNVVEVNKNEAVKK